MVNQFSDAEAEIRELPNVVSDEAYPMQRDLPMFLTSEAEVLFLFTVGLCTIENVFKFLFFLCL